MTEEEQKLFVSTAVGISFQLGFSSLLFAAAMQRGSNAARWLSEFEEKVVEDAQRMQVGGDVPAALVEDTIETVIGDFRQVFDSVRARLASAGSGSVTDQVGKRSGQAGQRVHCWGRG
ncbi:MAG TPA: hypothetical protein VHG92_00385 [Afifellaceae bacterium]|nr:hypothetical protein [Afifellaceae bacterium]